MAFVAGMKKTNDHAEPTKVEHLKKTPILMSTKGYISICYKCIDMQWLTIKASNLYIH